MSSLIVVVGSSSSATRLARRIMRYGKPARVISTPANLRKSGGCSQSVKTDVSAENIVRSNLRGITVKGMYIEEIVGETRYYHDIFR